MTETLLASAAGVPGTGSVFLLLIVLLLLVAAKALLTSISAIWEMIADLLGTMFASVRALAIICLLIACFVAVAVAVVGVSDGGAGVALADV
ncbi:hypothetical protein GCM10010464_66760 [Pseudonocardia yunnanensis]|uniref:Uncharacterized protein n=1 Tax=Pseudonocardia yunnanensis TaxID=58107 RepID=A0ABW4F9M4_9PSEU